MLKNRAKSKRASRGTGPFFIRNTLKSRLHTVGDGRHAVRYGRHAVHYGRHAARYGRNAVYYGRNGVDSGRHTVGDGCRDMIFPRRRVHFEMNGNKIRGK